MIPVTTDAAQPTYDTATVDGNIDEWNLANDFFANRFKAGKSTKEVLAKLYLRYDCSTNTLYALVLPSGNNTIDADSEAGEHFIKVKVDGTGSLKKLVDDTDVDDGTPSDFAFVNSNGSDADGWEASGHLAEGNHKIKAHTNVNTGDVDDPQTAATSQGNQTIDLDIDCSPTLVELSSFTATIEPRGVLLRWRTETEVDNAGFNLWRSEAGISGT